MGNLSMNALSQIYKSSLPQGNNGGDNHWSNPKQKSTV